MGSVNIFPEEGIDRKIAGVSPFPIFWQPNPSFDPGNGAIQDVKIDSCTIEGGEVSSVYEVTPLNLEDPMFGTYITMTEGLSVENSSETVDEVEMSCQLSMIVRAGTKVYQDPEIEIVNFKVPLHDTLFGELDEIMEDKMEDIEDTIATKESDIERMEEFVDGAGWYCSIVEFIMKLMMVLQVLKIVMYVLGWIVYGLTAAFSSEQNARESGGGIYYWTCYISDVLTTTFITNLWQVDSWTWPTAVTSPGYWNKIMCSFFTCRFTETTNFIELFGHIGRTDGGSFSGSVDGVDRTGDRNSAGREDISEEDMDRGDVWLNVIWEGDNRFSAYRSYPIAKRTLCGPAQLYGMKKERQILCMYRTCYRDLVSGGFSPEICDRMYEGRHCLYVDGAAYRVVKDADWNKVFAGIFEWLLNQLAVTILTEFGMRRTGCPYPHGLDSFSNSDEVTGDKNPYELAKAKCGNTESPTSTEPGSGTSPNYQTVNPLTTGALSLACGVGIMAAMYMDIGDWMDWDDFRNMYEQTLGDPDFCAE